MKLQYILLAAMIFAPIAMAQDRGREPVAQGINGKTLESCKADIRKYCDAVVLKQECLVAHWKKISSDCQDGLATPMRGGGD